MMAAGMSAGPMGEWRQLAATALLGTERAGGAAATVGGEPGVLLGKVVTDEAPQHLLNAAAVLGLYTTVGGPGRTPVGEPLPPAHTDDLPEASVRAGGLLTQVLFGEYRHLLDEWCSLAAACGVRAPDELLPALLEAGAAKGGAAGAGAIRPVLGARGAWLAAQNPEWCGLKASGDPAEIWRTGTTVERLAALAGLRRSDPAAARALIAQTWAEENPDDRAAIVECLAVGISQDDEPFLEDALDDKRKPVRLAAGELLARLPESRYRARMLERAQALLSFRWHKALLRERKLELTVRLPESVDKAMARDGVEARKRHGMGEKAAALAQILAGTSLAVLAQDAQADAAKLVAEGRDTEFAEALLRGWSLAAVRQRDAAWAAALLAASGAAPDAFDEDCAAELCASLEPSARESLIVELLGKKGQRLDAASVKGALRGAAHAWSLPFSRAVLAALRGYFATEGARYDHPLRKFVAERVSRHMAPQLAAESAEGWPNGQARWHKGDDDMVHTLAATLAFRQIMHEELRRETR